MGQDIETTGKQEPDVVEVDENAVVEQAHRQAHELGLEHEHMHEKSHGDEHAHSKNGEVHGHSAHGEQHAHEHGHHHPNSKAVSNRLARAIGHLEAVKRMVDREEDCAEILTQLAAVRSAINNAGKVILMDHLNHCIVEAVEENDMEKIKEFGDAIQKFVK